VRQLSKRKREGRAGDSLIAVSREPHLVAVIAPITVLAPVPVAPAHPRCRRSGRTRDLLAVVSGEHPANRRHEAKDTCGCDCDLTHRDKQLRREPWRRCGGRRCRKVRDGCFVAPRHSQSYSKWGRRSPVDRFQDLEDVVAAEVGAVVEQRNKQIGREWDTGPFAPAAPYRPPRSQRSG
jgi:hypothetical protein